MEVHSWPKPSFDRVRIEIKIKAHVFKTHICTEGLKAKFESGLGQNFITLKSFQSLIELFMTSSC